MRNRFKIISKKYEKMFYVSGLMTGFILSFLINFIFHYFDIEGIGSQLYSNTSFRKETNKKLLNFIEGTWASSVNDMFMEININKDKNILIIEINDEVSFKKEFKIVDIDRVDGILGLVSMDVCDVRNPCTSLSEFVPIQINKIFGIPNTITLLYDSRFSMCKDPINECTRAFRKRS